MCKNTTLFIQEIGGDTALIGVAGAVAAMSEMPVMFRGDRAIKRLGGVWNAVAIATAVFMVRWWLLSLVTSPAVVLWLQVSHGVSFGLFLVASIAYVDSLAPRGLSATAQSLLVVAT